MNAQPAASVFCAAPVLHQTLDLYNIKNIEVTEIGTCSLMKSKDMPEQRKNCTSICRN